MDYLLALDAGGTKISLASFTPDGSLLDEAVHQGGNFSMDYVCALLLVLESASTFISRHEGEVLFIALGASGMRGCGRADDVQKTLSATFHVPCRVVDDGMMGLYARFGQGDGILVISGTGSVCYGKKGGRYHSVGGWGHLVDDRGSGTWIALQAVRAMLHRFDMCRSATDLDRAVLDAFALPSPLVLPRRLYSASKAELASLAPLVEKAALEGDDEAMRILLDAGDELAGMVRQLADVLDMDRLEIGLVGSILDKCEPVRRRMFESLPGAVHVDCTCCSATRAVVPMYEEWKGSNDTV